MGDYMSGLYENKPKYLPHANPQELLQYDKGTIGILNTEANITQHNIT